MNRRTLLAALAAVVLSSLSSNSSLKGQAQQSPDNVWQLVGPQPQTRTAARTDLVGQSALARFDRAAFNALTATDGATLSLPMSDGRFMRFRVAKSPILVPELAAAFPEIQTFAGQGIDDPSATTRFGWTEKGFHAIVLSTSGTVYIDPYAPGDVEFYAAVQKEALREPDARFVCLVDGTDAGAAPRTINNFPITNGTILRTYRLALAATGEYTVAAGGTKSAALSRMVASMNRVNGIYQRELAVTMTLSTGTLADPTALIYTSGGTDPYTNSDGSAMLAQNQANIDAVVGTSNYDIGHVFSTGGGGIAALQSPCSATNKARGVTGLPNPTGDAFDVDYVAHEMGHQFGGNHTFNGTSSNCAARSSTHAYEVGSGSTIQAYAGICTVENLQPNSNDYFTFESLNEMTAFITSGGGSTCGTATSTGNSVPVISTSGTFVIPISTPFVLGAVATDANNDTLTYDWEQYSLGASSSSVATATSDDGTRPLFRSYSPTTNALRYFPSLSYVLNNANTPPTTYSCTIGTCLVGETLPTTSRTMTYMVTVRDNRSGGGGISTAAMTVTSTTSAGPFRLTSPNGGGSFPSGPTSITWNVAGSSSAPVSAANVRVLFSSDGGATFGTVIAASTPNDGSELLTLPMVTTSTARLKIEAVGNIFFDVSDANFSVVAVPLFTDDPLVPGTTPIKALHITELRSRIDTLRVRYGLTAAAWTTDPTLTAGTTTIKAAHLTEMRTALSQAYVQAGFSAPTYSPTTITAGTTTITAAAIADLRSKVLAIW